ncbi:MAG: glycoside hydrolase, partial [Chloroflexota bacterium]
MSTTSPRAANARADWEERIGRRSDATVEVAAPRLPAPTGLRAIPGRGQVTLDWQPVEGAIGYVVERGVTADGPFAPIDTGNPDVMAVPGPPFADTTAAVGQPAFWAVGAISAAGNGPGDPGLMGERSEAAAATPRSD